MKGIVFTIGLIVSIICAVYVGFYLMLIGGIVDIVKAVTTNVNEWGIAVGVVKVLFSGVVGYFAFLIPLGVTQLLITLTNGEAK